MTDTPTTPTQPNAGAAGEPSGRRVFVTGGHGFIGARVVAQLLAQGDTVRCLVRTTSDTARIDHLNVERATGDVRDAASVAAAMAGCHACIHLASVSSWDQINSPVVTETVIDGTRNVLAAAVQAGVRRTVFVSTSIAVNGSKKPVVHDERSAFELVGSGLKYAEAKNAAETLVAEHLAAHPDFEVVIVNPAEVYGPEDTALVTAGNLRDFIKDWPALACKGGTAVTHVDDVASGMVAALDRGRSGERYILGGDNLTVTELARLTVEIAGQKKPVWTLPNALLKGVVKTLAALHLPTPVIPDVLDYATRYFFMSSEKAKKELGYAPRDARACITPVVFWLREAGHVPASKVPAQLKSAAAESPSP